MFSSSGTLLGRVAYEGSSGLLEFGWSRNQVRATVTRRACCFTLRPRVSHVSLCAQLLVCVHRDGRVLKHDVHGRVHYDSFPLSRHVHVGCPLSAFCHFPSRLLMGRDVESSFLLSPCRSAFHGQLVALCRVWSDGIVVLTNMNHLLVVRAGSALFAHLHVQKNAQRTHATSLWMGAAATGVTAPF